ncbi:uncharacterized protein LOC126724005 isoform X2 [Quercus robur]|uniref:uncharacterized protein LOC126724005 isoform X2 n=1 Tax=Quercus robur TaxID=38942 RepID=UPI002161D941|nr:uncharacterized protein LOC126724005 isoform X2 [Quercus robur]
MKILPVIDMTAYLAVMDKLDGEPSKLKEQLGPELTESCKQLARVLSEAGAVVVKDPRCSAEENEHFIEMMERYYETPVEYKRPQERPSLRYQVGITPEKVEVPRAMVDEKLQEKIRAMCNSKESQPATLTGPDLKWRYMWSVGPRPSKTQFKELNADPVIPEGFPGWVETMNSWGYKMMAATEVVAEMLAIGYGLPKDAFTSLMKQIEYLTAGDCMAGLHEVIVTDKTIEAIKQAKEQNRSLWRVSSTFFAHIASDAVLKPLGHFAESPLASNYPPLYAGELMEQEFTFLNLKGNEA